MKKRVLEYAPRFFAGPQKTYDMILDILRSEIFEGKTVYPNDFLRAFKLCDFKDVRVVILGQDPYHNGLADGLAWSTYPHNRIPKSLERVFKEYVNDLGFPYPKTGDLSDWARRGVLLLNTVLTVERGKPFSHIDIGWHYLILEALHNLNDKHDRLVFMLWGNQAQRFKGHIDESKHLVLTAPHPSPVTRKDWLGHHPFSQACDYLGLPREFWKLR